MRALQLLQHLEVPLGIAQQVGLVREQQRRQVNGEHVLRALELRLGRSDGVIRGPVRLERHAAPGKGGSHAGDLLDAVGVGQVDDQQRRIGRLQRAAEPGDGMLRCNRWQIDELEAHVIVTQHPRFRVLCREWKRARPGG